MLYKINAFHPSIWQTPETLQIGLDNRNVVLPQITPAAERFIDALYFGVAENQVSAMARQTKLPQSEANKLLQQLGGLLEQQPPTAGQNPNPGQPINLSSAFASLAQASLEHSTDGRSVLHERGRRAVFIPELDAGGLLLLQALAASGVGTFVTKDLGKVTDEDLGPLGYPIGLRGQLRHVAANMMLQASWPSSTLVSANRLKSSKLNNLDLAILVNQFVLEPNQLSHWNNRQVAHLQICYQAAGVWVSAVVVPGETPCLICRELHLQGIQPSKAAIDSQLLNAPLRLDHSAAKLVATGLAAATALQHLDQVGGFAKTQSQSYWLSFAGNATGKTTTQICTDTWDFHPECGCKLVATQFENVPPEPQFFSGNPTATQLAEVV